MTRWLWMVLCHLGLGLSVAVAAPPSAESVVRDATAEFYGALDSRSNELPLEQEELYRLVDETLLAHVDLERMSRWVLGKYWNQASAAQRADFSKEFKSLLIRTYATAVQKASLESIVYLPARESARPDRSVVRTKVLVAGAEALPIDYYMHFQAGHWLVYDVRIESISLVTNYRNSFGTEINRFGLQVLIDKMEQNNRQHTAKAKP